MTMIEQHSINTIRLLAADMVQRANSGHPGMPMGMAAVAYVLFTEAMHFNPKDPQWHNRDRFILSAGHGSALLYAMLHLCGYPLSLDDLKAFRQLHSKTPGHPEFGHTTGVETTTGPLGQGFATGVGMAIAEKTLAHQYNSGDRAIFNHHIFGICGDGCLMEGITAEAASLAGHLQLGKLIYFYDDNQITIEGRTQLAFSENVVQRFEAYGWQVLEIDGLDIHQIRAAITLGKAEKNRPTLIKARTIIGYGSPNKADTHDAHGSPLGEAELSLIRERFGFPPESSFHITEEVYTHFQTKLEKNIRSYHDWRLLFQTWQSEHPEKAGQLTRILDKALPETLVSAIPDFPGGESKATRQASGIVLNAIAPLLPELIGGSADLAPSTNTFLSKGGTFSRSSFGQNLHFGIREHAMGAIINGLAHSALLIPYGATFLVFSDYMRPTLRLAALMNIPSIFVFTHDSIAVGEDGPTHQPIEQIMSLRLIHNLHVFRPADANETAMAWQLMLTKRLPSALILTRQALPNLDTHQYPIKEGVEKGAYILVDSEKQPDLILMATGSEVSLALLARNQLCQEGYSVRVISMPCWELFEAQSPDYRESVLPQTVTKRISIEMGVTSGWEKWVGAEGISLGINHYGLSAPGETLMKEFGFTADNIVAQAHRMLRND